MFDRGGRGGHACGQPGGTALPQAPNGAATGGTRRTRTPWATRAVSQHQGVFLPVCIRGDAATSTQKDLHAKTFKGQGSESTILLSNIWVVLYNIGHKIFLLCTDKADYCAVVKIRAQWYRKIMKWPHRL